MKWDSCRLVSTEKEQKSSWDWLRDSSMERVFLAQSIVGLSSFSHGSPRITYILVSQIHDIKGNSAGYSSNVEEQGGGEPDHSFGIDRVIRISCLHRGFQALGRKFMFPDKLPIDTGDACSAVNEGLGINGFHHVRGDNKLDWDLHSG